MSIVYVWMAKDSAPLNFERVEDPIFSDVLVSQQLGQDVSGMDPTIVSARLGPIGLAIIARKVRSMHSSNGTFVPRLLSGAIVPQFNGTFFFKGPQPPSLSFSLCYDLYTKKFLRNGCWDSLRMSIWLQFWFIESYFYIDQGLPGLTGCDDSKCFLGAAKEFMKAFNQPDDCSGIKPGTCNVPDIEKYTSIFEYYAAYNIFSINYFFNSWYTAVQNVGNEVANNVDKIVQLIDPPEDTDFGVFSTIVQAVTSITAFVGPLGAIGTAAEEVGSAVTLADTVRNALDTERTIQQHLIPDSYPTGTTESQVWQTAQLKSDLVKVIEAAKSHIQNTTSYVMGDLNAFLAFANQDVFSDDPPSIQPMNVYVMYVFNTYIISKALNGNNIKGTIGLGTNPQALATSWTNNTNSNSPLAYDLDACKEFDEQNICDAWWYSKNLSSAFGLDDFKGMNKNKADLMKTLLADYTTGEMLFEASYKCQATKKPDQSLNLTVKPEGIVSDCISQLQIGTWDMGCDDPTDSQSNCEFLESEIPRQPEFLDGHTGTALYGGSTNPVYSVPYCYLGQLITQKKYRLKRDH
ncbi:MAG: hypothetical protein Q9214_000045 [Letrouitia sp. 1 TL-2023]